MKRFYDDNDDNDDITTAPQSESLDVTDVDIARELGEIRDLERRKQGLEERVSGMERDLGGLMR